jgi:superfamily II DNA or RNA helicase
MRPTTLAAFPAALKAAGDTSTLDLPLKKFLGSSRPSNGAVRAVKTVAMILRIDRVSGLCTAEAESLLTNRFSPEIALQVRESLWDWLHSQAALPGPRLADAASGSNEVEEEKEEEDDDDADHDDNNYDGNDDDASAPFVGHDPASPISVHGLRPAAQPRETLPAVEAPPQNGDALDRWADRYGVRDRLADRLDLEHVHHSYYGFTIEGLPATIREAVLVTQAGVKAPRYFRSTLASQLVGMAKSHLHRAAQAVAIARRRQTERAARARPLDDPYLLRFEKLIRQQRDLLAAEAKPRPVGTFLPGRIHVNSDALALTYREWEIHEGRTPNLEGETMFFLHLSAWESGSLRLECKRCREPLTCPHRATVLQECLEALHDPADPLAAALVPVLRVPGWSRLLERLDTGLGKIAPTSTEESQRLVWEITNKHGSLAVHPVLQRLGKRGAWGRGQRLRLDELERKQELLREVADREAFEGLMYSRDSHGYYSPAHEQTPRQVWRALAALTGSTRVFADQARSVPISVRKVRPALRVDAAENGFRLRLGLGSTDIEPAALLGSAPDGRHVIWLDIEHSLCLVALLEPATIALLKAMVSFPVALPAEGLAELVGRLPRLQSALDLHLPESVRGERVEPPVTTLCRLEPLPESGVRLDMAVRPIESGPVFPPGEGTPEVLHARDGRHLHALRALGAERERAAHLAQVLGLDDASANGAWRWDVADDGAALDLLRKLRDQSELAEVEWPTGEIRVDHASRGALKVQVQRRRDWFGVEGGIEIDGTRVPLSELLAAARAGRGYVRLNARRFATIEEYLLHRLAALDDVVFENQGAIELGLLAAPVLAELVEDQRQLDMVPAFRAVLGKLETARLETAALPDGLQATLRHYQVDGYEWLARLAGWGLGACLADDMGLGKTVQALALLLRRAELGPALVIAPTSVVANWAAECAKFAPGLAPRIYRGPGRAALLDGLGKGNLLITSYAIAVRDAETLGAIQFSTLIIDEAQSVKNALTQRFRAIRDLQADFRLALTGTPIENHLGELWAIFRLVTPGLLGSWEQFRQRFAVPIERHHDRKRQVGLARVVRPFLLRRTKAEVAPELPARTEMNQTIELGPTERRLYEAARIEALESLAKSAAAGIGDDARQHIRILAALTRLRLLCCHPRLVVKDSTAGSTKLAALVELLTELRDEGHRALVFSQFTSFLDLARPLLTQAGLRTLTLDGSTPAAEREERVRAFQAGTADAFLLSLRAGGTGLNLTAATYVIHLDPWWNPAVEDQATDRAHRIGQDRPVTVIRMVARGTIEEAVLSLHEEKRQLAASILDGADAAARLDGEDLLDLIRKGGVAADDEEDADEEGETGSEESVKA